MAKFDWKHWALLACGIGSGVCEWMAAQQSAGGALPFHISAATLGLATLVLGLLSKSLIEGGAK